MALLLVLVMLEAVVASVSAKAIGEDYSIFGYNAGWVLIIVGIGVGLLFASKIVKMPKSVGIKPVATMVAIVLVAGLVMVAVETPAPVADVTGLANVEFTIDAAALTTDGTYYPDTTFDDSSNLFTVPYKANTTSDLIQEHGDNSTYTDDPYLNFTIRVDLPDDADDNDLAQIYFEVVNPTLFVGSDADNYVLTKTGDIHQAIWTDQDGATSDIKGWTNGGIEDAFYATLQLDLYQTGLAQADVFDPVVLNIKFHNKANTFSESFTVQFVCSETWDDSA